MLMISISMTQVIELEIMISAAQNDISQSVVDLYSAQVCED